MEGTVFIKRAILNVPHGVSQDTLARGAYSGAKQFVERLEKEGWTLVDKVRMYPVPKDTGTLKPIATKDGKATLWVGARNVMRNSHPLYRPDCDQYALVARVTRPPRPATVDVPDDFIARGKLPASWTLKE